MKSILLVTCLLVLTASRCYSTSGYSRYQLQALLNINLKTVEAFDCEKCPKDQTTAVEEVANAVRRLQTGIERDFIASPENAQLLKEIREVIPRVPTTIQRPIGCIVGSFGYIFCMEYSESCHSCMSWVDPCPKFLRPVCE